MQTNLNQLMNRKVSYFLLIVALSVCAGSAVSVVNAAENNARLFSQMLPYAALSNAIYEDQQALDRVAVTNGFKLESFENIPGIEITYAILSHAGLDATTSRQKIVVIRGTANAENALVDMDFKLVPDSLSGVGIHQGFKQASIPIYNQIKNKLNKSEKIITTGHSLGGAAALVVAMQLQEQGFNVASVITFGQPKVTNLTGSLKFSGLNVIRVVTPNDLVPILPPLDPVDIKNVEVYWHSGTEIILMGDKKYAILKGVRSMLRGGEFLTYVPDKKNVEAHFMKNYLAEIKSKSLDAIEIGYKLPFNIGNLFKFGGE